MISVLSEIGCFFIVIFWCFVCVRKRIFFVSCDSFFSFLILLIRVCWYFLVLCFWFSIIWFFFSKILIGVCSLCVRLLVNWFRCLKLLESFWCIVFSVCLSGLSLMGNVCFVNGWWSVLLFVVVVSWLSDVMVCSLFLMINGLSVE